MKVGQLLMAVAAGGVLAASVAVTVAKADTPTITSATAFFPPTDATPISAVCGFTVLQTFTLQRTVITFTDDSGAVTSQIRHVSFDGSLIDAATGAALPWRGVWTQTLNVAAGTITVDGLRQEVQGTGETKVMQVGHLVEPAANFPMLPPLADSTRADFADFYTGVCPLFSS